MADAILGGFSRAQERTHTASGQLRRCQTYDKAKNRDTSAQPLTAANFFSASFADMVIFG